MTRRTREIVRRRRARGDTGSCLSMNLNQLRSRDELGTDRAIVFVRTTGLRIGPWEAATDRGIVGRGVNATGVFVEEDAAAASHASAPFSPPGPIRHRITVRPDEGECFFVTESDAVGATG